MNILNEFEKFVPYEIEDIERLKIIDSTNKVLIQIHPEDTHETVGGIYTEGIKKFGFAKNTSRRATVIKACDRIVPALNGTEYQLWQTDVLVKPGDEIYMNYFDNLTNFDFYHKDMELKIVPYSSIIAIRRDGDIIMCNGYVLLEDYIVDHKFGEYEYKENKKNIKKIRYIGKPNERYFTPVFRNDYQNKIKQGRIRRGIYGRTETHFICQNAFKNDLAEGSVKPGDIVIIEKPQVVFDLEEWAYARFDDRKVLKVTQQYNIIAQLNV